MIFRKISQKRYYKCANGGTITSGKTSLVDCLCECQKDTYLASLFANFAKFLSA